MYDGYFLYDSVEILNTSRTVAYAEHLGAQWVQDPDPDVSEALPPLVGALNGYSTPIQDDAPWADPDDPDSWYFYGLIPLEITGLDESTRSATVIEATKDGGTVGRIRNQTRTTVFHVLLVGDSDAACKSGFEWLKWTLLGKCDASGQITSSCGGAELEFLSSVPTEVDPTDPNYPAHCVDDYWCCLYRTTFLDGPHILAKNYVGDGGAAWEVEFTCTSGVPSVFGIEQPVVDNMFGPGSTQTVVTRTNRCTNPNFETGIASWNGTGTPAPTVLWSTQKVYSRTHSMKITWTGNPVNSLTAENSSFEGGSVGTWVGAGTSAPALTNSTLHPKDGSRSMLCTWAAGAAGSGVAQLAFSGLQVGVSYVFTAAVWVPSGSPDVALGIAGGTVGASTSVKDNPASLTVTFTATTTTHQLQLVPLGALTAGQQVFADSFSLVMQQSTFFPGVYYNLPTIKNHVYTVSAWLYVPQGNPSVEFVILQNGLLLDNKVYTDRFDEWCQIYITFTAAGDYHWITFYIGNQQATVTTGQFCYVDAVLMEESGEVGSYFDGSSSMAKWTGTPNGSMSQLTAKVATVPVNPAGGLFDDVGTVYDDVPCPVPVFTPINDPLCPTVIPPPSVPSITTACFTPPTHWIRYAAQVPDTMVPLYRHVVPIISLNALVVDTRWVRVRFYPDWNNDFSIDDIDPCSYVGEFLVSYLPAGSVLTIDGARQAVRLLYNGADRNGGQLVFATDGGPFVWPELSCGYGYIMTIDCPPSVKPPVTDLTVLTKAA